MGEFHPVQPPNSDRLLHTAEDCSPFFDGSNPGDLLRLYRSQNRPKHGAASKGRGARAPRKRNRPRVLRGRLSQVASLPRPKTKVAYLGGRMTELKHRKGACVMAYLILANEEARVCRTHGALENRPPAS